MPEVVNTSFLGEASSAEEEFDNSTETMIKVDDVSMIFNMASETMNNLKEYAIALARRELHFKEFRALDHISLEVKKGDVFGILGTNGSGKSTLLKIIAGVLEPSEGTCTVNGSIAPLIELGAGFDMELTARENIYLNGALLGYSKRFIEEHFDEIVEFAEIEKFLDMPLKNYSSGMVARIAFAIATVIIPEILIVDEVLSVGDFMFQQKCERRINTLIKEYGVTVLIVSHSNDQIERLCNKAIWIEKGHERIAGNAHDVCQVYRMLGGHFGSPEAEQRIFGLLQQPAPVRGKLVETFSGENRYSTPVKILESLKSETGKDHVIIAPGLNHAICMVANAFSSLDGAPILLTRTEALPELVEHKLRELQPNNITILGGDPFISEQVITDIKRVCPSSNITAINENTEERVAYAVFCLGKNRGWSKKAILTYKEGLGDIICFLPYTYRQKIPLLFSVEAHTVADDVTEELNKSFSEILLLGGQDVFENNSLVKFNSTKITRFCGKDPFDANEIINDWIEKEDNITESPFEAFLVPIWNPADILAAGPLTKERSCITLVEDTQNLDSVTRNLDAIISKKETLSKLVFFGDHTQFSELDKDLMVKALLNS